MRFTYEDGGYFQIYGGNDIHKLRFDSTLPAHSCLPDTKPDPAAGTSTKVDYSGSITSVPSETLIVLEIVSAGAPYHTANIVSFTSTDDTTDGNRVIKEVNQEI